MLFWLRASLRYPLVPQVVPQLVIEIIEGYGRGEGGGGGEEFIIRKTSNLHSYLTPKFSSPINVSFPVELYAV